ncbi:STAS domain-containing protein [Mucilaginibacter sp. RS28]|uniref:STAS domain-containing protein n=1 Tax=Mucilaginibacter straminoryzae TaxID=2932774 RepID=A0A9X2BD86_9SPHI|nr:STAS domain-containing protein [Mucilaginibacter straminoryzae]MCJ8211832.1 STAS domain-containing protein [Mucilaginibacter straminoryzae]
MIELIKQEPGYLLADLQIDEANLAVADQFKTELIGLLDNYQRKIVLSLHQVNYIDSSFLGALVAGLKHAIAQKHDIILVGLKKDIRDLLTLIRLDKVFKIYDNYTEATSAL